VQDLPDFRHLGGFCFHPSPETDDIRHLTHRVNPLKLAHKIKAGAAQ
jgi:hypothetical protein